MLTDIQNTRKIRHIKDDPIDQKLLDSADVSMAHMLRKRVAATPDSTAFSYPNADDTGWDKVTWGDVGSDVSRVAAGLISLGIELEDRVAIISLTSYDWILADFAIMYAGAATTTVYNTSRAEEVAHILSDSGSRIVFAENQEQVEKLQANRSDFPDVIKVITMDNSVVDDDWVITLDELRTIGDKALSDTPSLTEDRINAVSSDHIATIVYTSGTTGMPKGVRLKHGTWAYMGVAIVSTMKDLTIDDVQYLWLPLAHVFGKVLLSMCVEVGMETAVDGRQEKIVENLSSVQPTYMAAVPRLFEKVRSGVIRMMAAEGGVKEKLFHWASGVGIEVVETIEADKKLSGGLKFRYKIADKLVLSKIRARFGGRMRFVISGSAALDRDIAKWFESLGIVALEGYGLTETAAATTVNRPYAAKTGTTGWPVHGTIADIAEDGELLISGPGVMDCYHGLPEETEKVLFQKDGRTWFRTGDIAEFDDEGFVKITDRKKDIFKTSNGKYFAPGKIEAMFKGLCPYASQIVVDGANRPFVSALVVLDPDAMEAWAEQNSMSGSSYATLVASPGAKEMVEKYIGELNSKLNNWEQIKRFTILDKELTVEDGELTPSMKLKRKTVIESYKHLLDAHYSKN